jgi:hypothetical protein
LHSLRLTRAVSNAVRRMCARVAGAADPPAD